ncbi:MAG: hypothetical protein HY235_27930 [Acidobacteria bacterium]|nr:hypothetical protein [Acidobacteriota bacterium]
MASLTGTFRLQYFFDVAEEIALEELRQLLQLEKPDREPSFRRQAPAYVRFERPPLEERLPALRLASGEHFPARIRYYDYGVIGLEMELPFQDAGWEELIGLASKWIAAADLESVAEEAVHTRLGEIMPALRKPYSRLLSEDYTVIELRQAVGDDGQPLSAPRLLERRGAEIAQIVRGESGLLSASECQEVLASSMSYAPTDLLVAGWTAALVYDTQPEGGAPTLQLLDFANTQLLEFRHYDEVLTRLLADVYPLVDRKPGFLRRWRMAREAQRLNALRLEVMELTERTDNAIKFLSDMFYARAYELAAQRIGVPDYRTLVDEKLRTAGELYRFLIEGFHQGRAFILELLIVIILIIDLFFLFQGKGT